MLDSLFAQSHPHSIKFKTKTVGAIAGLALLTVTGCLESSSIGPIQPGTYTLLPVHSGPIDSLNPENLAVENALHDQDFIGSSSGAPRLSPLTPGRLTQSLHFFQAELFHLPSSSRLASATVLTLEPPIPPMIHPSGFPLQTREFAQGEIHRDIRTHLPTSLELIPLSGNIDPTVGTEWMTRIRSGLSPEERRALCDRYLASDHPQRESCETPYPLEDIRIYSTLSGEALSLSATSSETWPIHLDIQSFTPDTPTARAVPGTYEEYFPVDGVFLPECVYDTYASTTLSALSREIIELKITLRSSVRSQAQIYSFVRPRGDCDELAARANQQSPNRFLKAEVVKLRFRYQSPTISLPESERTVRSQESQRAWRQEAQNHSALRFLMRIRDFH